MSDHKALKINWFSEHGDDLANAVRNGSSRASCHKFLVEKGFTVGYGAMMLTLQQHYPDLKNIKKITRSATLIKVYGKDLVNAIRAGASLSACHKILMENGFTIEYQGVKSALLKYHPDLKNIISRSTQKKTTSSDIVGDFGIFHKALKINWLSEHGDDLANAVRNGSSLLSCHKFLVEKGFTVGYGPMISTLQRHYPDLKNIKMLTRPATLIEAHGKDLVNAIRAGASLNACHKILTGNGFKVGYGSVRRMLLRYYPDLENIISRSTQKKPAANIAKMEDCGIFHKALKINWLSEHGDDLANAVRNGSSWASCHKILVKNGINISPQAVRVTLLRYYPDLKNSEKSAQQKTVDDFELPEWVVKYGKDLAYAVSVGVDWDTCHKMLAKKGVNIEHKTMETALKHYAAIIRMAMDKRAN